MIQQKNKSKGIIRNKLLELNRLKGKKKAPLKRFSKGALRKTIDDEQMNKSSLLSDETRPSEIQMSSFDQPMWTNNYKECVSLLREVEILQQEISKEKIKKMSSVNQKKHDLVIQQFVKEATIKLNKCEKRLKQMEHIANFSSEESHTNKKTLTSMLISMATNIREQARKLRSQQQSQLHRQRQLKKYTKNILQGEKYMESSQTQSWLSEQDFELMQKGLEKQRNEQIHKIVQSIYSLNGIYKQLQTLVLQQGSLLDRIDSNIDSTIHNVQQANKHLEQAKKKMQSNCFSKTRIILIILIAVFLLIFLLKHS